MGRLRNDIRILKIERETMSFDGASWLHTSDIKIALSEHAVNRKFLLPFTNL
jgi:hypothetical protein